jgi:hypothetical protein
MKNNKTYIQLKKNEIYINNKGDVFCTYPCEVKRTRKQCPYSPGEIHNCIKYNN